MEKIELGKSVRDKTMKANEETNHKSHPVREDWDYQGKRPDQVESSCKISCWCMLALTIIMLIGLIITIIQN